MSKDAPKHIYYLATVSVLVLSQSAASSQDAEDKSAGAPSVKQTLDLNKRKMRAYDLNGDGVIDSDEQHLQELNSSRISENCFLELQSAVPPPAVRMPGTLFDVPRLPPGTYVAHLKTARRAIFEGNYSKAIEEFTMLINTRPIALAYALRAQALIQLGYYNQALSDANQSLALKPDNFTALLQRGRVLYRMQKYDKALADLTAYLQQAPDGSEGLFYRRLCYQHLGDYAQSLSDRAAASEKAPLMAHVSMTLRERELDRGESEEQATATPARVGTTHGAARSHVSAAPHPVQRKQTRSTRSSSSREKEHGLSTHPAKVAPAAPAKAHTPHTASDAAAQTDVKMHEAQIAELKDLNKLIAASASDTDARYDRGFATLALGRYSSAADDFKYFLTTTNWNGRAATCAAILCAICYEGAKQPEQAIAILREATSKLTNKNWPYPIIDCLLHKTPDQSLFSSVKDQSAMTSAKCYVGLFYLLSGGAEKGKELLSWVRSNGDQQSEDYALASCALQHITPGH